MAGVDADSRATSDRDSAEVLVRNDEAIRRALTPPAGPDSNPAIKHETPTAPPTRLLDRAGNYANPAPVLSFPPRSSSDSLRTTLHALQEWEGYVVEINGDEFVARLIDLTAGSTHEEEEATIPLAEIAEGDAATLKIGRVFRWVIGYERSSAGTKKRVSHIVFRDLPRLAERDFREGKRWARDIVQAFNR